MLKHLCSLVFALAIVVCSTKTAYATSILDFSLTPNIVTLAPGGSVEFNGTLHNPGTTDVFLNGTLSSLLFPSLNVDPTPFFLFSPLFLTGGQAYSGPFFDVTAGATTFPGIYGGSFTIQGGADANTFDNLATQTFQVDVSTTSVPEPGTFVLLVTFLTVLRLATFAERKLRLLGLFGVCTKMFG